MIVHAYYLKDARVRRYAELLASVGNQVDVLCLRERDEPVNEQHLAVNIHRINVTHSRGGMLHYFLEYSLSFIGFFFKLNRLYFRGNHYQLIHIHNFPNLLVFTAALQKILGVKILLDIHDPMPELYRSKFRMGENHPVVRFLRLEERISTRYADVIIAANHAFKQLVGQRSCPQEKIEVILNVPDDKFYNCPRDRQNVGTQSKIFSILYVGTLAERYGLDVVLKAIKILKKDKLIDRIQFTLIPKIKNEGTYTALLMKEVHDLGLDDTVILRDPVPNDKMPGIISDADVSVYTPRPDVHMDIALSLKIPEIIAVGRPLVTSRIAVLEKYFGEDALFMFEPGNVDECAQRLLEVYQHPEDVRNHVNLAQEALREFSWDKQKEVYFKVLVTAISDKG